MEQTPRLIVGGTSKDARGIVYHVNPFQFTDVKRVYFIENHEPGYRRGWNGHQREKKYFMCVKGEFTVCLVKIDNWENPSSTLKPLVYNLSESKPEILEVPCGYANIVINKNLESRLMVMSDMDLETSLEEKIRYPSGFWNQ